MPSSARGDVAIVVGGQAGQGIQTIEFILTRVLKRSGFHVFATKEYMSRIRGGSNSTLIRVGDRRVPANVDRIDVLVPLDDGALDNLAHRISPGTLILGEKDRLREGSGCVDAPFTAMAESVGGKIYANTVAIATLCGILRTDFEVLRSYLADHFRRKGDQVVARNVEAARKGYDLVEGLRSSGGFRFSVERHAEMSGDLLVSGAQAVALGAVSGGCRLVASYPMSPSTAVLTYMARNDRRLGLAVEQAEDEIAAVNMAIGAWYAGARAMVTTSGGGFALMEEGVSLAGITETPLVIHLGQRPGPATGMATRTEQADLDLALYSGHGEFPRIIYAPGTIQEAFALTHRAFDAADRYQVPVFVLTDQYFIDSYYCVPSLGQEGLQVRDRTVPTRRDYRRYAFTEDGISPRGVPGFGEGLVVVDSHEHTEEGHITEQIHMRNRMMEKRMGKIQAMAADCVPPSLLGPDDYRVLVIGWGSNYHILAEAVGLLGREDMAVLHFSQLFPLPPGTEELLSRAERTIAVENNYAGQMARLLRTYTGFEVNHSIRKYDGRPFCSEDLAGRILRVSGRRGRK